MTIPTITSIDIQRDCERIRHEKPLVHNITNFVVMEQTANALLALGASPIMAHAEEEVETLAAHAGCLVLNIGTLSTPWLKSMELAQIAAKKNKRPIVIDPVGAGATELRTHAAQAILEHGGITAIRGNASEIAALAGSGGTTRGVDSTLESDRITQEASTLAKQYDCIVIVSGAKDFVTNGVHTCMMEHGDAWMSRVTGMGCTATALLGAFLAVNEDAFRAAIHATLFMGLAGEWAHKSGLGLGSTKVAFIDVLGDPQEQAFPKILRYSWA